MERSRRSKRGQRVLSHAVQDASSGGHLISRRYGERTWLEKVEKAEWPGSESLLMTAIESSSVPLAERTGYNPWLIAVVVSMATFMEVLDTSIANVSLPHIAGSVSATPDEATWVLTSYLVSNAVILPISGWLATVIGRKRFYMTCVALFAISSLLCGLAPNLPLLIIFRVMQGIGGGGLAPSEQAILADTFPPQNAGWRSQSMGSRWSWPRRLGRRSAGGSPTTFPGDGSSSSTCRWESCRCF